MTLAALTTSPIQYPDEPYIPKLYNPTGNSDNNYGIISHHELITDIINKPIQDRLSVMKKWKNNWDGYGSSKPSSKSINLTQSFISNFINLLISRGYSWIDPNITADSDGDIVLEWFSDPNKLTIYVSPEEISYIKVDSPQIDEMEDGTIDGINQIESIWKWLIKQ